MIDEFLFSIYSDNYHLIADLPVQRIFELQPAYWQKRNMDSWFRNPVRPILGRL